MFLFQDNGAGRHSHEVAVLGPGRLVDCRLRPHLQLALLLRPEDAERVREEREGAGGHARLRQQRHRHRLTSARQSSRLDEKTS